MWQFTKENIYTTIYWFYYFYVLRVASPCFWRYFQSFCESALYTWHWSKDADNTAKAEMLDALKFCAWYDKRCKHCKWSNNYFIWLNTYNIYFMKRKQRKTILLDYYEVSSKRCMHTHQFPWLLSYLIEVHIKGYQIFFDSTGTTP